MNQESKPHTFDNDPDRYWAQPPKSSFRKHRTTREVAKRRIQELKNLISSCEESDDEDK